jgi:rubrerythrin
VGIFLVGTKEEDLPMLAVLSPANVLDTAIQIERYGAIFYRKAAEYTDNKELRDKLMGLAIAEDLHAADFTQLKRIFVATTLDGERIDNEGLGIRYLESFSRGGIFNMTIDAAQALAKAPTMKDLLDFAIEREKDSILFYNGIRAALTRKSDREIVDAIINEELEHLTLLHTEIKGLQP